MSAERVLRPAITRRAKVHISAGSAIRSSMSAMRRRSRAFNRRSESSMSWQGAVIYRRGEFQMDGFRKVLEVNLMSLMACATRFHAMLSASKGSLIIVSSTAAYHSTMGNPAYNASKTGAVGLTRTLAQAWAENGIRVNGIAPGLVDTKMTKVTTSNPKRLEGAIERIPLKRLGTPADMAGAALFLASPLSSYVLGQTIVVDGGLIL
jgi:3-oxoacyl-[acyl-carrier protein] reductase